MHILDAKICHGKELHGPHEQPVPVGTQQKPPLLSVHILFVQQVPEVRPTGHDGMLQLAPVSAGYEHTPPLLVAPLEVSQ